MSNRLAKMLELAAHPSTSEHEALAALRKAREHLDRSGLTITSLLVGKSSQRDLAADLLDAVKQRTMMQGVVDELRKAKAAADHEVADLRARLAKAASTRASSTKVKAMEAALVAERGKLVEAEARIAELEQRLENTGTAHATKVRVEMADRFAQEIKAIIDAMPEAIRASPKVIAHELNSRGIKSARGGLWEGSQVSAVLRRAAGG
jgi:hypothetical protein